MKRKSLSIILTFAILAFFLLPAQVFAQNNTGVIKGKVVNKTINQPQSNQEVTLSIIKGQQRVGDKKTTTDAQGNFSFSGLTVGDDLIYMVATNFEGADYRSKEIKLTAEKPSETITLDIYNSSTDPSKVKIKRYVIQIEVGKKAVKVVEFLDIENSGNTSYAMDNRDKNNILGLVLELPSGYKNLKLTHGLMECCSRVVQNKIYSTMSIPPGPTVIMYEYELSDQPKAILTKKLPFKTDEFFLAYNDAKIKISSSKLKSQGQQRGEGGSFYVYAATGLSRGETVDIEVSGLPRSANRLLLTLLAVVIGLVFIGGVTYTFMRRSRAEKVIEKEAISKPKPQLTRKRRKAELTQKEELKRIHLEFISRLDELYESGEISESVYRKIRENLKAELAKYL